MSITWNGHFKMLGAKLLLYHALVFKEDNQVEEIFGVAGCEVVTTGTYSVSGARLNISLEDSVRKLRPSSSCIIPPSVGKKFISYDEVLLKNDSLYLRVFSPGNFLIQQCPNGVVFEQLMQSKRRLQK